MSTFLSATTATFTSTATVLDLLPSEIMWKIMQTLEPIDLSTTRLVCRKLRRLSDHPLLWKDIQLRPAETSSQEQNNDDMPSLWSLAAIKSILQLHVLHVQTIQIWGVRDNIVQYILLNCHNLRELTISGWCTLSDHAFRISTPALNLRRLRLIGQRKSKYTSLDATTFGTLLKQCPCLEEIAIVSCQIHVQAESLLRIVAQDHHNEASPPTQGHYKQQQPILSSLRSLVVATKKTWSSQHVTRLFQLCSNLRILGLVPDSIEIAYCTGIDRNNDGITPPMLVLDNSLSSATNNHGSNTQPAHLLTKSIHAIQQAQEDDVEMLNSDNLIVYKLDSDNH